MPQVFGGTEEALIENLIGYTLTEQVQINMTTGAFQKIKVQPDTLNRASDPALMSLLEGQGVVIKSLTNKVKSISEAPERSERSVPTLCPKELHELALVWNHPQRVTRVLYYLKCAFLKEALPLDTMTRTPQWDDEAQKPVPFSLSDDQKKDTTVWTEVVETEDSAGDAHMDDSSGTPPPRCCPRTALRYSWWSLYGCSCGPLSNVTKNGTSQTPLHQSKPQRIRTSPQA